MSPESMRIARRVAPRVALAEDVDIRFDGCLLKDKDATLDRCIDHLCLLGRMGEVLLSEPDLLREMAESTGAVASHPAVDAMTKWLAEGGAGTLRLRLPPFVLLVVRGVEPAVLQVVGYRKAPASVMENRPGATSGENDHADGSDVSEIDVLRLIVDVACAEGAARKLADVADRERRAVLHQLVVTILIEVARAGVLVGKGTAPAASRESLVGAVAEAISSARPLPLFRVSALGFEVTFELCAEAEDTPPFRIVEIRDDA